MTMTDAKVITNPVNSNLEAFRKEMKLINVTVYPDMLVYSLPSPKLRNSCIPDALNLINKLGLPLEALRPGTDPSRGNTFIVQPITK